MSRVIDSSNRSQGRRDARFPAVVDVTALVAAASTALCMHIGVPALSGEIGKCRKAIRQAALPSTESDEFLQSASPAERPGRLDSCLKRADSAYPSRSQSERT
jgi:hypothetical protein